jgi:ABC-type antimicrobial peptide transport system permease subunit
LGSVVTAITSRLATSVLVFRLPVYDAAVFLAVAIVLALCGLTASCLPARLAAHIDPVIALRTE